MSFLDELKKAENWVDHAAQVGAQSYRQAEMIFAILDRLVALEQAVFAKPTVDPVQPVPASGPSPIPTISDSPNGPGA